MKKFYKFILGGIVVVVIAALAMFNKGLNSQSDNLSAISWDYIEALAVTGGHNEEAIILLNISRGTYYSLKKKLGIE
jgi:hypothetical protein